MDIAYQGLGSSMEDDAYGIRLFAEMGFDMLVCQSFSKNLGLYGERYGALNVVCSSSTAAANVYDQLRCLIRWEFSSPPLYGARLADSILQSSSWQASWPVLHHNQHFFSFLTLQQVYRVVGYATTSTQQSGTAF